MAEVSSLLYVGLDPDTGQPSGIKSIDENTTIVSSIIPDIIRSAAEVTKDNSATWSLGGEATISDSVSGPWQDTTDTVTTTSGDWNTAYSEVSDNSSVWQAVRDSSGSWDAYSTVSGDVIDVTSLVSTASDTWNSGGEATIPGSVSGPWQDTTDTVISTSEAWNGYSDASTNLVDVSNAYVSTSGNFQDATTLLGDNSSVWTVVKDTSTVWQDSSGTASGIIAKVNGTFSAVEISGLGPGDNQGSVPNIGDGFILIYDESLNRFRFRRNLTTEIVDPTSIPGGGIEPLFGSYADGDGGTGAMYLYGATLFDLSTANVSGGTYNGRNIVADGSKLDGIEANAQVNTVDSVNGSTGAVSLNSDDISEGVSNLYLRVAERNKLSNIEASATADQTGAEIKAAYEGEADTNAFTDALLTKLNNIEANATADQSDSEIETAYNNQVSQISSGEITAGTETAIRRFSPDDVRQMAVTHGGGGGGGVTDHGALTGLTDDDHTQYVLADGTRAFTGPVNLGGFNLSNVGTVDGRNISSDGTKLDGIEAGATVDQDASTVPFTSTGNIVATNVQAAIEELDSEKAATSHTHTLSDITDSGGLAALDTVGASEIDNDSVSNTKLSNVSTNTIKGRATAGTGEPEDLTPTQVRSIINVEDGATADQTGAEIKTAYEGEANTNAFTDALLTKLNNIEANAEVNTVDSVNTQTGAVVLDSDDISEGVTNLYLTSAERSKLTGIESGATADQTGAEIKSAYEGEANTNAFTDAEKTKLSGIESNATADQSDLEIETAYNNQVSQVSPAERTAGTETAVRRFSPSDVTSMISQHESASITDHGALTGLSDDDHTQYILADGTRAFTGNVSFSNNILSSVGDPVDSADAANKGYVDSEVALKADSSHTHTLSDITDSGSIASKDFWTGTQSAYDAIGTPDSNTIYFITE